ncbi:hypothetical protein Nepgr_022725 [Nepenthes gracilis]|uniref:RING-type E3 ubiquitin transferase n=1 Tax=Nepenthes gracilis TaxID=150966 RepID=A0AAD3SZK5_NEPGR|nr:hypothetical protein Nepgr_022725 [Nepenthes gracilis]
MESVQPSQQNFNYEPPAMPTSNSNFPILAIAVLGIMATALLLVGYYVCVIKGCLNRQQHTDSISQFSLSPARQSEDPLMAYSPTMEINRGLEEWVIRDIPTLRYKRKEGGGGERSFRGCAVCLSEFQERDMLRVLPRCSHLFHLDCIDIWLMSNANCPLCRSSISGATRCPVDQIVAPSSSPQELQQFSGRIIGDDEDFVVIELGQETEASTGSVLQLRGHSERKIEANIGIKKPRKIHHFSIMGDEYINVRKKDEQFSIQPIRRSFSMDSAADPQLYLQAQEIIQQRRPLYEVDLGINAILPIESNP